MKCLLQQVNKIIIGASKTPEEAIDHFLINLIKDIKSLGALGPKQVLAKVSPFKDRIIKYRLEDANTFIKAYNDLVVEKSLEFAEIAKYWQKPKSISMQNKLVTEAIRFQSEAKESFDILRKASESHSSNFLFILENYNMLTKSDITQLEKVRSRLKQIATMTYKIFIEELKKGKMPQA